MLNARDRRVSGDQGAPAGEGEKDQAQKQTSDGSGQTTSNEGKPVIIDPDAVYILNPNRPNETRTGKQLGEGYNRGNLLDQTQSLLHKLESEFKTVSEEKDKMSADLGKARVRLDDEDLKASVLRHVESITGEKQTAPDYNLGYPPDESGGDTGISSGTAGKILQMMENLKKETLSEAKEIAKATSQGEATSVLDDRQKQEENRRAQDEFVGRTYTVITAGLRNRYPDLPESEIIAVAKHEFLASAADVEANSLAAENRNDEADQVFLKGHETKRSGRDMEFELYKKQQEIEATRQRTQQIETISAGGPPERRPKYEEPTQNKAEAKKRSKERLALAEELVAEREKYSTP